MMSIQRAGPYLLGELLGRGGMGAVYRARHETIQRDAAVKLLNPQTSEELASRLQREAVAAARLDHPGIVRVYDFGRNDDGSPYMAMELVEGAGFDALLKRGDLDLAESLRIIRDAALALEAAHAKGIIHRDMKPSNIMVAKDGTVKVTDFGIARLLDTQDTRLTATGAVVGTPAYMAPEQLSSKLPVSAQTDVYSLGATLYEAASGHPPVNASTVPQMVYQIVHETPSPPSELFPAATAVMDPLIYAADKICARAMAKQPPQRYASARELAAAIEVALRGEAVAPAASTRPPAASQTLVITAALVAAVTLIGGAALVGLVLGSRDLPQPADLPEQHASPVGHGGSSPDHTVQQVPPDHEASPGDTPTPTPPEPRIEHTAKAPPDSAGHATTATSDAVAHALQQLIALDLTALQEARAEQTQSSGTRSPAAEARQKLATLAELIQDGMHLAAHDEAYVATKEYVEPAEKLALALAQQHAPELHHRLVKLFEMLKLPATARLAPLSLAHDLQSVSDIEIDVTAAQYDMVSAALAVLRKNMTGQEKFKARLQQLSRWIKDDATRLRSLHELSIDLQRDPGLGLTLGAHSDTWDRQEGLGISRRQAKNVDQAIRLLVLGGAGALTVELQVMPEARQGQGWFVMVAAGSKFVMISPSMMAVANRPLPPARVAAILDGLPTPDWKLERRERINKKLEDVIISVEPMQPGDIFRLQLLGAGAPAGVVLLHDRFHHVLPKSLLHSKKTQISVSAAGPIAIRSLTTSLTAPPLPPLPPQSQPHHPGGDRQPRGEDRQPRDVDRQPRDGDRLRRDGDRPRRDGDRR